MNELEQYFEKNDKRLINKYQHYFDVYDRHFSKYKGQEVTIVEIGVSQGGSLQMWRSYFGPKAKIWGVAAEKVAPIEGMKMLAIAGIKGAIRPIATPVTKPTNPTAQNERERCFHAPSKPILL